MDRETARTSKEQNVPDETFSSAFPRPGRFFQLPKGGVCGQQSTTKKQRRFLWVPSLGLLLLSVAFIITIVTNIELVDLPLVLCQITSPHPLSMSTISLLNHSGIGKIDGDLAGLGDVLAVAHL